MNKKNRRETRKRQVRKGREGAKGVPREKHGARPRQDTAVPVIQDLPRLRADQIFSGQRPATVSMGVEPAFLLFERDVLERLERRADALGVRYESLVRQILRDHIQSY